jgi:hypothetical protein
MMTWFLGASAKRKEIFVNVNAEDKDADLMGLLTEAPDDEDQAMLVSSREIVHGSKMKSVPKFCATRWTARVSTLSALIAKYGTVLAALDMVVSECSGDAKSDAGSYIRLLEDPQFLVALVVAQCILSYCSTVTKTLQAVSCDLGKAYSDVGTVSTVHSGHKDGDLLGEDLDQDYQHC